MKNISRIFTIVLLTSTLTVATSHVKAQMKIGHINTGELLSSLPEAKKADSLLQQFQEVLKKMATIIRRSLTPELKSLMMIQQK